MSTRAAHTPRELILLGWSVEQAQTAIGRLVARGVLLPVDDVPPDDLVGGRVRRLTR